MPPVVGSLRDLSDGPIAVIQISIGLPNFRKIAYIQASSGSGFPGYIEQTGDLVGPEEWKSNMAAITCVPDGKTIPLGPSETILEAVLRADIPHVHACGGRAKCSTCRIVILKGLENCSPRTETEQAMASRLGFALEVRLACQTKTQGDVSFRRLVLDETDCEVASQLLKKRTGPVGESKPIAVLFSDIRGFTTLAQKLSPYDVMFALNRHFCGYRRSRPRIPIGSRPLIPI